MAADFDDGPGSDFSIVEMVLGMQRTLLGQLMSDGLAARILDSEGKFGPGESAFRLSELYTKLTHEVWRELDAKSGDIAAPRRELQREHLNRLAATLLRPTTLSRADARGLLRVQAQGLATRLAAGAKQPGLSAEARAHLADSADTLNQALTARLQRVGT